MKKKLTHNWGLKILSTLFAIVLWLIVVNIIDPVEKKSFNNVAVTIRNESVIENQGKVYDIIDNSDVISITVKGRRSALANMKSSDFVAIADMKEMIVMDTIPIIEISATKNNNKISEIIPKTQTVKISVEDSATKQFAITTSTSGTLVEGYAVGDITCFPSVLKVTGAASVVNKINKVMVTVEVSDVTTTISQSATPKFYDSDGDVIEATSLEYSTDKISVTVDLLKTKEVSLNFKVKGTPSDDYQYVESVYSPDTITIAGDEEELALISSLDINKDEDAINLNGATDNIQQIVDITSYLPSTVRLVDSSEASILVTAILEKKTTKNIELSKNNIKLSNLSSRLSFNYANNDNIIVKVKGLAENISKITADDITASIDLKDISETGTKTLPVSLSLSGELDAQIDGEVTVEAVITKSNTSTNRQ
ncbi:YbbR-like domain-containing protein [Candidatus Galacturonibacter soehngenii]|nr:CdaR family protein [Candidatus Galacturonibacter soehngenii]